MTDADRPEPVVVPHDALDPETLRRVVESFVLREGTDYGEREYTLEAKVGHVLDQLARGEAHLVFDPGTESVHIVRDSREWRARREAGLD
ncbi:MAG: YheU family protein [Pseudomonadota bacterium]